MHRKRTRFAARVHKVATALERRGVVATYELHDRVLANRVARLRHSRERPELDDVQTDVLRRLRDEGEVALDDPWLRFGLNPRLLDIANTYLGMWAKLEYVDVWYTPAAGAGERQSSQRWHRDFNDRHLLKAFLYLVDVDRDAGPFE